MYAKAREAAGFTQRQVAERLHIGIRTLRGYESGSPEPGPDIVLAMSKLYGMPDLTLRYCRHSCAIGKTYGYEILDAIDMHPSTVLIKLSNELDEARRALDKAMELVVNKMTHGDFDEKELAEFKEAVLEFLDIEHNVEVLKVALHPLVDVGYLVQLHNQKCHRHGYVKKENARSVRAS